MSDSPTKPSREEIEKEFIEKIRRMEDGFCPVCDQPFTREVRKCSLGASFINDVYAMPCGHRIGCDFATDTISKEEFDEAEAEYKEYLRREKENLENDDIC